MLNSPVPLRDSDLRAALAATIARTYRGRDHLLAPEVEILCGIPGRIDALLIADKICGYEIKSDVDSLHRLPRQLEAYEPVLQRGVLIVGRRHLQAAHKILPEWWGIWLAERRGHCTTLTRHRASRPNPDFSLNAVTRFLAREQITLHMRTQGRTGYSKFSIDDLRNQLVEQHSRRDLLMAARWMMRSRADWRYRARQLAHSTIPAPEDRQPSWAQICRCPVCEQR